MAEVNLTQSSASVGMPRLMRVTNVQGWKMWVNLVAVDYIRTTAPQEVQIHVGSQVITVRGGEAQALRDALNRNWIIDVQGGW